MQESETEPLIYPDPGEHPTLASTTPPLESSPAQFTPYQIPWRKVALLGFITQLTLGILWGLVLNAGFGILLPVAIAFRGLENALLVFYIIAIPVTYGKLKQWALDYPLAISAFAMVYLYGVYRIIQKVPSASQLESYLAGYVQTNAERMAPLFYLLIFLTAGALSFLLATYFINKTRPRSIGITILAIGAVGLYILAFTLRPVSLLESLPRVKALSWKLLPIYLPPGVQDGLPAETGCAQGDTHFAWYECVYWFENYPGYLSIDSQRIINKVRLENKSSSQNYYYQPKSFFHVTVLRDAKQLDSYKFKDDQCDLEGLKDAGTEPRRRDGSMVAPKSAKPQRCIKVTTPGGKNLYYDSYKNYSDEFVKVPIDFYFEQKGDVVVIRVGDERPLNGTLKSLYYTDPNFKPEFYKFVDSFQ